ncbi:receptor-like serine/threonine-protein kinase At4g25390 [Vigna umbellata]|uniref:receptor-like serine/threonine-protein kinase At4g25390 n=1 Tax=Vigna umbellata TaxID=87088 RepID=UPI001F5F3F4E|nr:receptor-like serine/threonine-protein kinase At4g25390 [Vigna umbellata]
MPSRQLSTSPPPSNRRILTPPVTSTASLCSLFFLLCLCFRKRKRTTPSSDSDSTPPHPFSYALLRRATNSFSTRLGHGGFGPVFAGTLAGDPVAVKLMDSASQQGEREFHNELFFASRLRSPSLVPAIGFSSDPKRRRFLLVYHLMHNGNLHDALLRSKTPHLTSWKNRFSIILDIARGIHYLHSLDPPVIHGDIKPSNILLDNTFCAKLADFGLARLKPHVQVQELKAKRDEKRRDESESDAGSELETVSVKTEQSFEGNTGSDYVMDWIGKELKKERPTTVEKVSSGSSSGLAEKKKSRKKLEWWEKMNDSGVPKMEKRRAAREWWKEEYSEELARKTKKKKTKEKKKRKGVNGDGDLEIDNGDVNVYKREKNRSRKSGGSVDSWLNGDVHGVGWNSYDSGTCSGEIVAKSGGVSSTPSMRGTVFYVAPEYGYNGDVSEKCDVYSFGVLLLVIVSGRRPLQVTGSPISELQRANLVSWARICGRRGKLLEVVDEDVEGLDKEQASLCVTVALACLLKSPTRRPSMKEVLGMLSGELEPPQLPRNTFPLNSRSQGR